MIKTHAEYANAIERLAKDREVLAAEEKAYRKAGLTDDEVQRALEPHQCFHQQLQDEVDWYDSVRRGEPYCMQSLQDIGKVLIGIRIALGMSQREFAKALEVDESQVSRDERNEYHGVTVRRAQEMLSKVGASIEVRVRPPENRQPLQQIRVMNPARPLSIVAG